MSAQGIERYLATMGIYTEILIPKPSYSLVFFKEHIPHHSPPVGGIFMAVVLSTSVRDINELRRL